MIKEMFLKLRIGHLERENGKIFERYRLLARRVAELEKLNRQQTVICEPGRITCSLEDPEAFSEKVKEAVLRALRGGRI